MLRTHPTIIASVAANPSPLGVKLHNAGYAALGLDYTYLAMGAEKIEEAIDALRLLSYRGMGVSMPFKQSVISCLDEVDSAVTAIGACNTVVNEDGNLLGYNTDWNGAADAISEVCDLNLIQTAVIVGAGGVARAISFALKKHGIKVFICARNKDQREKIVSDLSLDGCAALEEQGKFNANLVVNATPIATIDGPTDLSKHPTATVLLDVVFQKRTTELDLCAINKGLKVAYGWRMLLLQGVAQFKLYTKQTPPIEAMSKVLEAALPE